jgi:hypothetical protein
MRLVAIGALMALSCAPFCNGQERLTSDDRERPAGRKLWWISIAAVAAATLLDVESSVGKYEQNPVFRSGDGTFNARRALAIKAGALGAATAAQYLIFRHERRMPTAITVANFGAAGALGGIAVRNWGVPKAVSPATPLAAAP